MRYQLHAVYLMRDKWSESNYKIGFSKEPTRRLEEVRDQYGADAQLLSSCWFPSEHSARQAEKIWHRRFKLERTDDHTGREWFSLADQSIESFLSWCNHSDSQDDLRAKLFKGHITQAEAKTYVDRLHKAIPRVTTIRQPVDVWRSPDYYAFTKTITT